MANILMAVILGEYFLTRFFCVGLCLLWLCNQYINSIGEQRILRERPFLFCLEKEQ